MTSSPLQFLFNSNRSFATLLKRPRRTNHSLLEIYTATCPISVQYRASIIKRTICRWCFPTVCGENVFVSRAFEANFHKPDWPHQKAPTVQWRVRKANSPFTIKHSSPSFAQAHAQPSLLNFTVLGENLTSRCLPCGYQICKVCFSAFAAVTCGFRRDLQEAMLCAQRN